MQGDLNAVKVRLAQGDAVDLRDEFGATPLLAAVWAGQSDVARFLLGRGANVNADSLGNTPLLGAAVHDPDGTLTTLLLRAGAKIGHENREGENALTLAARSGRVPVLTLLAEKGAKVNERTSKGMTPLVTAAACGQESAVAALLDAGAEINLPTSAGDTALMAAASNWRTEVARLLLERGADRTIKNAEGRTALDLARNLKRPDIVALLEKAAVSTSNQPGPKPEGPAPQLVRSNIDDNDMAVDPALTELVWTFDQPMNQRRYHLIPSAQKKLGRLPEFVGEDPTFFRDERTFVLRVKLEPNTRYAIGLNDDQRLEFRSVRGVPLEPLIYPGFLTGCLADDCDAPGAGVFRSLSLAPPPP
jgi:ankyrin repeat protein